MMKFEKIGQTLAFIIIIAAIWRFAGIGLAIMLAVLWLAIVFEMWRKNITKEEKEYDEICRFIYFLSKQDNFDQNVKKYLESGTENDFGVCNQNIWHIDKAITRGIYSLGLDLEHTKDLLQKRWKPKS